LEIVMVRRSLDAAKAIRAGNSRSLITSVNMYALPLRNSQTRRTLRRASLPFG
jgi:hypothetical protein